jgi:hypothetical protein
MVGKGKGKCRKKSENKQEWQGGGNKWCIHYCFTTTIAADNNLIRILTGIINYILIIIKYLKPAFCIVI